MTHYLAAGLIFALTFGVILSERIHRTIVAIMGAIVMVVAGRLLGFYSEQQALAAIDWETLGLLLGMMILVQLLERTGFFEYLAIMVAKRTGSKPWMLLVVLGTVTAIASMFLDNVTTVVFMAPVTILIAEILGRSPIPFLMAEALLSNVGGAATLVGDPPNILIGSAAGFTFNDFLIHLGPIVFFAWLAVLGLLLLVFLRDLRIPPRDLEALMRLDERAALHDPAAFRKILTVLLGVILVFFVHHILHLEPAFVALAGAGLALLWVQPDMEETIPKVEWNVLLFFAALFALVGGLDASGVLQELAKGLTGFAQGNLLVAGLVVLWASAILSAIVDNIPFTIVMIPVLLDLGTAGVNTTPLWWALALGAGFGGNGTPVGSTAGVIVVSLSAKTKRPITTLTWLRSGLPVMLVTCLVATILFVLLFDFMSSPAR